MGGVRPGAGFESPAAMRRRWLAGIFAISALWAIMVAVISNDHVHELWGEMAAVGYGLALAVVLVLRHARTADIALGVSFLGGLIMPLGGLGATGRWQPQGGVVATSGWAPTPPGPPYPAPAVLAGTTNVDAYNPYLP